MLTTGKKCLLVIVLIFLKIILKIEITCRQCIKGITTLIKYMKTFLFNKKIKPIKEKDLYNFYHRWRLRSWIPIEKLNWYYLSSNENACYLLDLNLENKKISWNLISSNPSAMNIIEKNMDKINWSFLSKNPNGVHLLKKNLNNIHWNYATSNTNTELIKMLENYIISLQKPKNIYNFSLLNYVIELDSILCGRRWDVLDMIAWYNISSNPSAIDLLTKYPEKIDLHSLSRNPSAIHLLEKNMDKIDWSYLSVNPNSIHLLEKNMKKINWFWLSHNPSGIHILEKNQDKIDWDALSQNPSAIHLLEKNQDKIYWNSLSQNPSIFELDYDFFHKRMNIIRNELMRKTWHIDRYLDWCM